MRFIGIPLNIFFLHLNYEAGMVVGLSLWRHLHLSPILNLNFHQRQNLNFQTAKRKMNCHFAQPWKLLCFHFHKAFSWGKSMYLTDIHTPYLLKKSLRNANLVPWYIPFITLFCIGITRQCASALACRGIWNHDDLHRGLKSIISQFQFPTPQRYFCQYNFASIFIKCSDVQLGKICLYFNAAPPSVMNEAHFMQMGAVVREKKEAANILEFI